MGNYPYKGKGNTVPKSKDSNISMRSDGRGVEPSARNVGTISGNKTIRECKQEDVLSPLMWRGEATTVNGFRYGPC